MSVEIPKFIQIHTLRSFPSVLLNRDESGLAKRVPFGGTMRTRISSQCLKRHWRVASGEWSLDELNLPRAVRSRRIFSLIVKELVDEERLEEGTARKICSVFVDKIFQQSKGKAKSSEERPVDNLELKQAVQLGRNEINYLKKVATEIAQSVSEGLCCKSRLNAAFSPGSRYPRSGSRSIFYL